MAFNLNEGFKGHQLCYFATLGTTCFIWGGLVKHLRHTCPYDNITLSKNTASSKYGTARHPPPFFTLSWLLTQDKSFWYLGKYQYLVSKSLRLQGFCDWINPQRYNVDQRRLWKTLSVRTECHPKWGQRPRTQSNQFFTCGLYILWPLLTLL